MTSTGPETPDKTPPSQGTTRDLPHQPPRTEDQVVDTTTAQAGDVVLPSAPGEPVVVARRQGMFGGSIGTSSRALAWAELGAHPAKRWTVFGRAELGAGQGRVLGGVRYEW